MSNKLNLDKSSTDSYQYLAPLLGLRGKSASLLIFSFAMWGIFSLPGVLYSKWFPLDMGDIFHAGAYFKSVLPSILSPYNGSGRYCPFYWLYYALQFQVFGENVAPYFFVQSLIFLIAAILTCSILYSLTRRHYYAILLIFLIYTSSPIAENLNTLGKAEPLSYFLILCILAIFCRAQIDRSRINSLNGILVIAIFALAMLTKETSVVLLGFALTGIVFSILIGLVTKNVSCRRIAKEYGWLLGYLLASICCAKIPYVIFKKTLSTASYTDYLITPKLVKENIYFYITQQPDVLLFGLLALVLLGLALWNLLLTRQASDEASVRGLIFALSICAMTWAYYLGLMIWRWPMGYYMLIPAILFRFCVLYGIFKLNINVTAGKIFICSTYSLIIVASIFSVTYIYYITCSQIAYSRIYTEAVLKYKNIYKANENLIIESYPFYAEQVGGTAAIFSPANPKNFHVKGIADLLNPSVANPELLNILGITPMDIERNIQNLPKSKDYLLVFTGNKLATWFLRGVAPYFSKDSILKEQNAYSMKLISQDSINNTAVYINTWTNKFEFGTTSIGYKLYQILDNEPRFFWKDRYPDGWIGSHATLRISKEFNKPVIIRISTPSFSMPNKVTITKNGRPFEILELTDTHEKVVQLRKSENAIDIFNFSVERSVSPKSLKINGDKRKLGIRITLDTDWNWQR